MAREDTRWFVVGVVILALVIMLALPLTVLMVVDYMKMKSDVQYELRQIKKLERELRDAKAAASKSSGADGMP